MEFIDLKAQQNQINEDGITLREDIDKRIKLVLDHGKYILGPEVRELEEKLAEYVGVKHCLGVSSGTDALVIALMALGIKTGDEIITTPFSFFSTVEAILLLGAKPIFVDIEKDTYNINPRYIEPAISRKTKAILPVSLFGQPSNFSEINKLGTRYKIPIIEDGAQSFGSKHQGKRSCSLSTIGTTSFFPSKPLGCYGDGGACFTNDDLLAKRMREISVHGQTQRYTHNQVGINGRLDTLQATILLAKLKFFEKEVTSRERIGNNYTNLLKEKGFLQTPFVAQENSSVYAQYTIQVENREKIVNLLKDQSIPTSIHYPKLISDQKALKKTNKGILQKMFPREGYKVFSSEQATKVSKKVLSLPMHPLLNDDDQILVINRLIDANKSIN
tara:strand:+ start:790 stop:1953 length:1164 start_codon:yes stop_codon:yes gene_type:complete